MIHFYKSLLITLLHEMRSIKLKYPNTKSTMQLKTKLNVRPALDTQLDHSVIRHHACDVYDKLLRPEECDSGEVTASARPALSCEKWKRERKRKHNVVYVCSQRYPLTHSTTSFTHRKCTNNLGPPAIITKSNANLLARQGNVEDCLAFDVHLLLDERILFGFLAKP